MSDSKHTPGPWVIDDTGMYLQIRGNLSGRKHMAHEEIVARPYHLDDAHLIAAAPEMLEYLEIIASYKAGDVIDQLAINSLKRIIAKARGES